MIMILIPSFEARLKEERRLYVFGNKIPRAMINPAVADMIIAEISSVPCIQITMSDFSPNPFEKNKYSNVPTIRLFVNKR